MRTFTWQISKVRAIPKVILLHSSCCKKTCSLFSKEKSFRCRTYLTYCTYLTYLHTSAEAFFMMWLHKSVETPTLETFIKSLIWSHGKASQCHQCCHVVSAFRMLSHSFGPTLKKFLSLEILAVALHHHWVVFPHWAVAFMSTISKCLLEHGTVLMSTRNTSKRLTAFLCLISSNVRTLNQLRYFDLLPRSIFALFALLHFLIYCLISIPILARQVGRHAFKHFEFQLPSKGVWHANFLQSKVFTLKTWSWQMTTLKP